MTLVEKESEIGATHAEQILESARRNNTELLLDIKVALNNDHVALSDLINSTRELISRNTPLHIACAAGNWEFIDIVLDIEGVEIDPQNRAGETPLHLAAKYVATEPEHGRFVVDNLLDAGSDPRIKDNDNLTPKDYAPSDDAEVRNLLESAEYAISMEAEQPDDLDGESESAGDASDSDAE